MSTIGKVAVAPECPHCRTTDFEAHRYDCSVARKTGQKRRPPPVAPLVVGAVVVYQRAGERRAAIVVSQHPTVLRVLEPDGKDFHVEDPEHGDSGDEKWAWAAPVAVA